MDDVEGGPASVIFSLTVESTHAIDARDWLRELERTKGVFRDDDEFFCHVGRWSCDDSNWSTRADKLDAAVIEALDRLDANR